MLLTFASNQLTLFFVFNILLIGIVFVVNGADVSNSSTTHRITINKQIKNDSFFSLSTDVEVADLTKTTHHFLSTSPMTPVPISNSIERKVVDDNIDFIIDQESDRKINSKENYRFNATSGAIAAATCLGLVVVSYIGIVLWKNIMHGNYDNREILINDDDIGDINDEDWRHFEAVCIEIQA